MSDNVKTIHPDIAQPTAVHQTVVDAFKQLLAMAERGEVSCVLGAALDARGAPFQFLAGNPGTGVALVGQMHIAALGVGIQMVQVQRPMWQGPAE